MCVLGTTKNDIKDRSKLKGLLYLLSCYHLVHSGVLMFMKRYTLSSLDLGLTVKQFQYYLFHIQS